MSLWVPVEVLDQWDIRYTLVKQRPGDLVVTAPGAYHQGWSSGWNVAEAISYGDGKSAARACGYRYCNKICMGGKEPLIVKWPEVVERPPSPSLPTWDISRDVVPVGAQNLPLSVEKLLLTGRGQLSDVQVDFS
jgi:hypothetical protein